MQRRADRRRAAPPTPRSTDSLHDRAQEILERLGYPEAPYDSVQGWRLKYDYITWTNGERNGGDPRPALPGGRTGTINFWYRTSPIALVSTLNNPLPTTVDPPFVISDMRMVYPDPSVCLLESQALSPRVDEGPAPAAVAPDWTPLFEYSGLTRSAFHEVEPRWLPRSQADVRAA